jgi:hypothetical protein
MSTLPPERQVSRDVPVVTADGATAAAYNDPNSPESIMRRAKTAEVQAATDSKYDNNTSPYEGFQGAALLQSLTPIQWFLLCILFVLLFLYSRSKKRSVRSLILGFGVLIILLFVAISRR